MKLTANRLGKIKALQPPEVPKPTIILLEHDNRFGVFPEFVFYDFMQPVKLPGRFPFRHPRFPCHGLCCLLVFLFLSLFVSLQMLIKNIANLKGSIDRLVVDPPFLSEDCQTKTALTMRWMAKVASADSKLIVCTGERMETLVTKLYKSFGLRTTTYEPHHATGLSNEFYCYANFECGAWKFKGRQEGRG